MTAAAVITIVIMTTAMNIRNMNYPDDPSDHDYEIHPHRDRGRSQDRNRGDLDHDASHLPLLFLAWR